MGENGSDCLWDLVDMRKDDAQDSDDIDYTHDRSYPFTEPADSGHAADQHGAADQGGYHDDDPGGDVEGVVHGIGHGKGLYECSGSQTAHNDGYGKKDG